MSAICSSYYYLIVYRYIYSRYSSVFPMFVKNMQSGSGVTRSGVELLQSRRELTTKVGEQPWPQLICYVLIFCHVCGYIFQED